MAERLSRRLPCRDRRRAARRARGHAARADPAHDPLRHRIGQCRGRRRRPQEGRGQAGVRRQAARHGRGQPGRGRGPAQPAGGRQHLGRGRSARARRRVLPGAHGRGRAALRWRALRRARARRFELRQLLRGRAADRCPPRGAGRRAHRAARRVRPRLRSAGGGLVGRRARGAGEARRAGPGDGRPRRRHHPRRLRRAGDGFALLQGQSVPGRDHREHQPQQQPLDQADDPSGGVARGLGAHLRARRLARHRAGERPGDGRGGAARGRPRCRRSPAQPAHRASST